MIAAKVFDNGKVFCGRPGCPYQLGRCDREVVDRVVWRLFLSGRWRRAEDGAWQHGEHRRRGFPREDEAGSVAQVFGDRREYAIELPALVICARCHTRQTVPSR